jgi:hypothetical protein
VKKITQSQLLELRLAVKTWAPQLAPVIAHLGTRPLSDTERQNLREAIAMEIVNSGMDNQGELNKRGIMLDDLVSVLHYY